jgi:hypothetical protein
VYAAIKGGRPTSKRIAIFKLMVDLELIVSSRANVGKNMM